MGLPKINNTPKKDLNQLRLTDEQLSSGEFPQEEVFLLKSIDGELGYFWQYDLKDFVQQDTSFEENTFIQKMGTEEWIPLFEHPFFQRRKPQIVSNIEVPADAQEYFILEQGQKIGPFSLSEIREQVECKKLLLTDMISIDDGHSWCKLYDLDEFDRRNESQSFLPHAPEKDVLSHSEPEVSSILEKKGNDATEYIAGLAYLGKNKAPIMEVPDEEESSTESSNKNIQIIWVALALFSMVGIGALMLTREDEKNTDLTGNSAVQRQLRNKARLEKAKAAQVNKDNQRSPAEENSFEQAKRQREEQLKRRERLRRSTPFKKSRTFKRAERMRNQRGRDADRDRYDDNYYDDASEPVELDPVRRTLSKDTIDPALDEENVDEYEEMSEEEAEYEKERRREEEEIKREEEY